MTPVDLGSEREWREAQSCPHHRIPVRAKGSGMEGTGQLGRHRLRAELGEMGGGRPKSQQHSRQENFSVSQFNEYPVLTLVLSSS